MSLLDFIRSLGQLAKTFYPEQIVQTVLGGLVRQTG